MPNRHAHHHDAPTRKGTARLGNWLPADPEVVEQWLGDLHEQVESREEISLHPVIREFEELVARDPIVRMYPTGMIRQVPDSGKQIQNIGQLLRLINEVLTQAPEYDSSAMVGVPINAILDRFMGTPAGVAAFRR